MDKIKKYLFNIMNSICIIPFIMLLFTLLLEGNVKMDECINHGYFGFYTAMGLIGFTTVISYIINHKDVKFSVLDLLVTAFFLLSFGVTLSNNPSISADVILFIMLLLFYSYLRIFLFQYKFNLYVLFLCLLVIPTVSALYGMGQFLYTLLKQDDSTSMSYSLLNIHYYAQYLAVITPIALFFFLRNNRIRKFKNRKYYMYFRIQYMLSIFLLGITLITLLIAQSTIIWIAAFVSSGLVIFLYCIQYRVESLGLRTFLEKYRKKIIYIAAPIILLFLVVFPVIIYYDKRDSLITTGVDSWAITIESIRNNLVGYGLGYTPSLSENVSQEINVIESFSYAPNEMLQICMEVGVIPFMLFVSLLLYAFYYGIKNRRIYAVGGLTSLLVLGITSCPLHILPMAVLFVILLVLCVSTKHRISFHTDISNYFLFSYRTRKVINHLVVVCILTILSCILFFCLQEKPVDLRRADVAISYSVNSKM